MYYLAYWRNIKKFWIAGNDKKHEKVFVNIYGERITYFDWIKGQPDNWKNEDCLHIGLQANKKYNDINCGWRYNFVLESRPSNFY